MALVARFGCGIGRLLLGHFLGNSKYFLGFNRDIAPFVLTPEMVHVMGGPGSENYNKFKDLKVPGTLGVFRPFAGARALAWPVLLLNASACQRVFQRCERSTLPVPDATLANGTLGD